VSALGRVLPANSLMGRTFAMLSTSTAISWLLLCAFGYAAAGILYTRRFK
jgi:hypothetical protein